MTDEQILDAFLNGTTSNLPPQAKQRLNQMLEEALRDPDEDYDGWEE